MLFEAHFSAISDFSCKSDLRDRISNLIKSFPFRVFLVTYLQAVEERFKESIPFNTDAFPWKTGNKLRFLCHFCYIIRLIYVLTLDKNCYTNTLGLYILRLFDWRWYQPARSAEAPPTHFRAWFTWRKVAHTHRYSTKPDYLNATKLPKIWFTVSLSKIHLSVFLHRQTFISQIY